MLGAIIAAIMFMFHPLLPCFQDMGIRLSPEAIAAADPDDNHGVLLKCETKGMVFEDDSGTFTSDSDDVALRLSYSDLKLVLWDHQHSSVKLRTVLQAPDK